MTFTVLSPSCAAPHSTFVCENRQLSCSFARRHRQRACNAPLSRSSWVHRPAAEKKDTVFGDLVESTEALKGVPEPGTKDFWEGDQWEWLGKISFVALPAILLLTILVGAFAAKTYDSGATTFLKQPSSADSTVELFTDKS